MSKTSFLNLCLFGILLSAASTFAGILDGTWELETSDLDDTSLHTMVIQDDKAYLTYTISNLGISCKINEEWQLSYKDESKLGITQIKLEAEKACPNQIALPTGSGIESIITYSLSENGNILKFDSHIRIDTYKRK